MSTTPSRFAGRSPERGTLGFALSLALVVAALFAPPAPASAASRATPSQKVRAHHRHKPKARAPRAPAASPAPAPISAVAPAPPITWCADAQLVPAPDNVDRVAAATLCLINQQRALGGLPPLRLVTAMTTAATAHSLDMVAQNYLSQDGSGDSSPEQRLTQTGYVRPNTAFDIAENLAAVTGTLSTPAGTVAAWMHSSDARAVILSATYTDTGIGVIAAAPAVAGSGPGATYTEDFGIAF